MTDSRQERLLSEFHSNAPASAAAIQELKSPSGYKLLPEDYLQFLLQRDGGEGFVGNTYLILWRADELLELNKAYQVSEYAPGLFLFGTNGGGEAFAFDLRKDSKSIVSIPFVGMDLELADAIAPNFAEFLETVFYLHTE